MGQSLRAWLSDDQLDPNFGALFADRLSRVKSRAGARAMRGLVLLRVLPWVTDDWVCGDCMREAQVPLWQWGGEFNDVALWLLWWWWAQRIWLKMSDGPRR